MRNLLGEEALSAFLESLQQAPQVSIRHNPEKLKPNHHIPEDHRVPWHPFGEYLDERPVFTLDPSLHAGAYYVQEASSMFLYEALRQSADFSKPLRILDLCAAPGGKSTLIASMMNGQGILVANEVVRQRVNPLRENMEKWGYSNIAVTSADSTDFTALEDFFDVIVVDAPCSGEGLFRKDPDAIYEWSPEHVISCSARQKMILSSVIRCLAPNGTLIYSTCTYNHTENSENASWISESFGLEKIPLAIPDSWGIVNRHDGYQFYPHRLKGEGFFAAAFRKPEGKEKRHKLPSEFRSIIPINKKQIPQVSEWLKPESGQKIFQTVKGHLFFLRDELEKDFLLIDKYVKTKYFGTSIGEFKAKNMVPNHGLALSLHISEDIPFLELGLEQALLFLKKETFQLPLGTGTGWMLPRYKGLNLGWIKALPNRMNNYLPPEKRIRMEIR